MGEDIIGNIGEGARGAREAGSAPPELFRTAVGTHEQTIVQTCLNRGISDWKHAQTQQRLRHSRVYGLDIRRFPSACWLSFWQFELPMSRPDLFAIAQRLPLFF